MDEDGECEIDETWPIGWLEVYSQGIGLSSEIKNTFCNKCKLGVLEALGYPDYKSYISVVKDNTELERRYEPTSSTDDVSSDVPFYLIDEDSN